MKALLILVLFGLPSAFCFWRAYQIQATRSVDGIVSGRHRSPMKLWVIGGLGFLAFALIYTYAAVDPAFLSIGKR